jgi:hypothetical protein
LWVLAGCSGSWTVPEVNTQDYRVSFSSASASESCSQEILDSANNFEPYSEIYRIYFPNGLEDPRFDLYWKSEGDTEEGFAFFAAGTIEGTLAEEGVLTYAGGAFREDRTAGSVTYEIEGRARASFGDQWDNAHEDYVITETTNGEAYPIGCVYTLDYEGRALADQGDEE